MFQPNPSARRRSVSFENLESRWMMAAQSAVALSSLPAYTDVVHPANNPQLPANFDTFAPQFGSTAPASGAPQIAEWTRTGGPNQTLVVSGDQFSTTAAGQPADSQFVAFGETSAGDSIVSTATIDKIDPAAADVTLGSDLPGDSMYLLWGENKNGFGNPVAVNKAEAWWVGPDAGSPGQTISVYGKNLTLGNETGKAAVWLEPGESNTSAGQWATIVDSNPYKLTIQLPANLASGNWQVWAHNGHGGELGWSEPVNLSVKPAQVFNGPVFNVRDYGASGNGTTDDQFAVRATIAAAELVPNSTVYFPAGTYLMKGGLGTLNDIELTGDGIGKTIIQNGSGFGQGLSPSSAEAEAMIFYASDTKVSDMTFQANPATANIPAIVYARGEPNLQFDQVEFDSPGMSPVDIHLSSHVSFEACTFIGEAMFMGTASQVSIDSCSFFMANDSIAAVETWGGQQLSLTNNTVQNRDMSDPNNGAGWGAGRLLYGNSAWGSSTDLYLGNNTTIDLGIRSGFADQNNGEQISFEGTVTGYDGQPSGATSETITPANVSAGIGKGFIAVIVSGKGAGQSRIISGVAGSVLTLQQQWTVIPDASSRIILSTMPSQVVIYGNTLSGRPELTNPSNITASVGVEMFTGVTNMVVDDNTFKDLYTGVNLFSGIVGHVDTEVNTTLFTYVANNTFENVAVGVSEVRSSSSVTVPSFGNILRNNTISGATKNAVIVYTDPKFNSPSQMPDMNVIEGTQADQNNAATLAISGGGTSGVWFGGNSFDSLSADGTTGQPPATVTIPITLSVPASVPSSTLNSSAPSPAPPALKAVTATPKKKTTPVTKKPAPTHAKTKTARSMLVYSSLPELQFDWVMLSPQWIDLNRAIPGTVILSNFVEELVA